jgi:short-subunit dehydrogenase
MPSLSGLARLPLGLVARVAHTPVGVSPQAAIAALGGGGLPLRRAVEGKVVLVTGASSGIGEATAERLAGAGAHVVLVARRAERLEDVRDRIADAGRGTAEVRVCDLADLEALDELAAAVLADHGQVDVLINNAGRSIRRKVEQSYDRFHDFERTMALNYFAPVRLTLALLPGMRERGSGHVVNVSSAGVAWRTPRFGAYLASKAALETFAECVSAEVAADGVRFSNVRMPLVRTEMIEPTAAYADAPALSSAEAADMIAQAIAYGAPRVAPLFGLGFAVTDAVSPQLLGAIRSRAFRAGVSG